MIGFYSFGVDVIEGKISLINQNGNPLDLDICDDIIDIITKYKENIVYDKPINKKYVSKIKRSIIFKIHGNNCLSCGKTSDIAIDHILPKSQKGNNSIDNLQVLCRSCNSSKGKYNIIDYRKSSNNQTQ